MNSLYIEAAAELTEVLNASLALDERITKAGLAIIRSISNGSKILTCGNGGSAADALHMAEELVGKYKLDRRALPAICLNADVTALTCIANDYGYNSIFSRQVEALGSAGDVLVGFSTSGNSPNVIAGFAAAREKGVITVFLGGKDGGSLKGVCEHEIIVPSNTTARIQEVHTLILHQWLEAIDNTDWTALKS